MAIPRATDQIYNDEVNSLNLVRSLFLANLLVLDLTEMWRSITLQRPNEARETEKVKDENWLEADHVTMVHEWQMIAINCRK
jgi:hypothetical protein